MVLARGFKAKHAALILYAVCAIAASLALLQSLGSRYMHIAISVVFLALVASGLQYLGYVEFSAAGRVLFRQNLVSLDARGDFYGRPEGAHCVFDHC